VHKEMINQNSLGSRRGMTRDSLRSSNIAEGDNRHVRIFRVSVSLFGGNTAQDQLALRRNHHHIPQGINLIYIRLQVANHPCRFVYPITEMLNDLITLMCSFRQTGFQIVDMFKICPVINRRRGNAEAGEELMDDTVDVKITIG